MPTEQEHRASVASNDQFIADVADRFADWEVVGLFYAALHRVDSRLAQFHAIHPQDHYERGRRVRELVPQIAVAYRMIETLSRRARYDCKQITAAEVAAARASYASICTAIP